MNRRYANLRYQIVREILYHCICILIILALWKIEMLIGDEDVGWTAGTMVIIILLCNLNESGKRYSEYNIFGFCRKTYYRNEVILSGIRSAMMAFVLTVHLTIFYEEYINMSIKGTKETAAMYHSVPAIEIFLIDFCLFMLINLFLLIDSTTIVKILGSSEGHSLQLKLRIEKNKEKNKAVHIIRGVIKKIVGFFILIAFWLGMNVLNDMLMRRDFLFQVKWFVILLLIDIGLYFIGKKRFVPKYI